MQRIGGNHEHKNVDEKDLQSILCGKKAKLQISAYFTDGYQRDRETDKGKINGNREQGEKEDL